MPAKWQRDLEKAWAYRSTIILCGNIRDLYPYSVADDAAIELLELDDYLTRWAARRARSLQIYDPVDRFRWAIAEPGVVEGAEAGEKPAAQARAADEFAQTAPDAADAGAAASVTTDVARIVEYLREDPGSGDGRCCILQFADRVAATGAADDERRDALIALEKLIHDMPARNHLIAVYLFAEDVPRELYVNESRATVIEIPSPERRDVREVAVRHYGLSGAAIDRAVNACHNLSLREVARMATRLGGLADIDALEREARLYKFGQETNYWDELSLDRLGAAAGELRRDIKGQDEAIDKVATVLVRARADIQRTTGGNPGRPRGVLFFAGPTGVGKTMTAQKLNRFLFGDEATFLRFDMSEYGQEFQVSRLYGAPPGYVGFEQGGSLTSPMQANPFRVVLFDEIEKADPRVFDIFLQILGDGRLTDSKGSVAHFSESIIIFTSNLGADADAAAALDDAGADRQKVREHFTTAVEHFFRVSIGRPELLNRIGRDNIVVFNYIDSVDVARQILRQHLVTIRDTFNKSYQDRVPQLRFDLPLDDVVEALLAEDRERIITFGGREVENLVNERVRDALASMVLEAERRSLPTAGIEGAVRQGRFAMELVGV